MSILSVENISPIGSGTSVTINNAATLVVNNVNSTGVVTATSFVGSGTLLLGTTAASNAESFSIHTSDSGKAIIKLTNSTTGTGTGDGFEFGMNGNEQIEFVNKENTDMFFATNNEEKLRIKANGKVGIGTINPVANAKLDVWGDGSEYPTLRLGTEAYNTEGEDIRFGRIDHPHSDIRYHSIYSYHHATDANNYLKFSVHKGSVDGNNALQADVMYLKGDGKVSLDRSSSQDTGDHREHP